MCAKGLRYLQHVTLVLVLNEPRQGGVTKRLIRLRSNHERLEVAVVKTGVGSPRVQLGLLLAPLDALVHHLAHPQQCHLHDILKKLITLEPSVTGATTT